MTTQVIQLTLSFENEKVQRWSRLQCKQLCCLVLVIQLVQ